MLRRIALSIGLAVLATASRAEAGMICVVREDFTIAAADLETFAKDPRNAVETTSALCLRAGLAPEKDAKVPAKFGARVEAACTKILARDETNELCVELAVRLGKKELAGVTLIDAALGWKLDVWSWDGWQPTLWVLEQLGDPRGATKVVDAWKANIDKAKKWEKRSSAMQAWAGWRKEAAAVIGSAGSSFSEIEFLTEQANATKDRHVKKACLDAANVLRQRIPQQ